MTFTNYESISFLVITAVWSLTVTAAGENLLSSSGNRLFNLGNKQSRGTLTITPTPMDCRTDSITQDGLGPCKAVMYAKFGTINVQFLSEGQMAAIWIMPIVKGNTRVVLICDALKDVVVFTQTGRIAARSDLPRTENGHMEIVVISTSDNGVLKCDWITYDL